LLKPVKERKERVLPRARTYACLVWFVRFVHILILIHSRTRTRHGIQRHGTAPHSTPWFCAGTWTVPTSRHCTTRHFTAHYNAGTWTDPTLRHGTARRISRHTTTQAPGPVQPRGQLRRPPALARGRRPRAQAHRRGGFGSWFTRLMKGNLRQEARSESSHNGLPSGPGGKLKQPQHKVTMSHEPG
jgi:hypothetical protein